MIFGKAARPLFGFYHPPEGAASRGLGVVLCNPLGYEAMCAHKTYRHLADRLAARGFAALRFDYHGTDDSSGHPDEPERLSAWLESIQAAIEELRERSGVREVALFGTRFGATLATVVAANRGDVHSLLLWAPAPSGRAYMRELRAFRMIKLPSGLEPTPREDGGEETAGYLLGKDTVAELTALDLTSHKERVARRVLIVPRDDLPGGEARLAKAFEAGGAEVRVAAEPGYAKMMRDPQETVVPDETLDKMVDWLAEATYPEERASRAPRSLRATMSAVGPAKRSTVTERPIQFGEDNRLFGILTEPAERPPRNRPALLFLNVGANHRVGPNRMYVNLARDLASLGYVSFRFDVAGLGDSRTTPGVKEGRLYAKDSVADVRTAMSLLTKLYGSEKFIAVGLCSGAYLAFHTCVEDTRVVGQVLMNPQTFVWREGDSLEISVRKSYHSTRYYGRALFEPTAWRRAVRGELNFRGVAGVLRERLVARTKDILREAGARARGKKAPQSEIERAFKAASGRGVECLLVYSFMDGGLDVIEKHLGRNARKMRKAKNFRLELVDGADHTFTPVDSQVVLHDLLVKYIVSRFPL